MGFQFSLIITYTYILLLLLHALPPLIYIDTYSVYSIDAVHVVGTYSIPHSPVYVFALGHGLISRKVNANADARGPFPKSP